GIKEVRDQTDRNGLEIMIELDSGTDAKLVANYLLAKTQMQIFYNYNNIAIKDNAPVQMGLNELIGAYLNHQVEIQTRYITYDLNKDKKRLEIVEGLIRVAEISDQVINTIRKAPGSKSGVVKALIEAFKFTELQANAIAELRLYRLSKTDQSVYLEERDILKVRITEAEKVLGSKDEMDNHLIELLKKAKKDFATERKTVIEDVMEKLEVDADALIKHEETWVGVTRQGYIKRFSNRAYEANKLIDYGVRDADNIIYIHKINTEDKLLVFTNDGKYVYIPVHKIEESKFKGTGKHVNDFAAVGPEARIVAAISVNDFALPGFIIIATAKGKIKRTKISSFDVARYSRPLVAIKLAPDDTVVGVKPSNGFRQIILITANGRSSKYSETTISVNGTKSSGVKGISLPTDDQVTSMVAAGANDTIGLVSKRGGAKRVRVNTIIPMSKSTQGKRLYKNVKGNPHITVDAAIVLTTNRMIFRDAENLIIEKFNKVDITTPGEGFSAVGPSRTIDAKILVLNRIHAESKLFKDIDVSTPEEKFDEAEKKIKEIDNISIDDLLKDL
ncbi:MAG: hypothetical protein KAG04_00705, partial [Mycoplasmataceae bacterium]|nr:hypothetical protein [Mycoplasmataceae bacterium]